MKMFARRFSLTAVLPVFLLALAHIGACESPVTQDVQATDARSDGTQDSDSGLSTLLDANMDADASPRTHPACDVLIDLNNEGTLADGGNGLRWTGSNVDAPEGLEGALQPNPSGRCTFRAIKQRLFRYRMQNNAALRVSTNNAGSDMGFDSVIFITALPCGPDARVLGCNDDDPFAPPNPHVTLSTATAPPMSAGTEVLIAVSGFYPAMSSGQRPNPPAEIGNFVLSLVEVTARAEGDACDLRGLADVCPASHHCLAGDDGRGRCVRDGASPGAACDLDGSCQPGLTCDLQRRMCFATAMAEMPCERFDGATRCGSGLTCVQVQRGQRRGVCKANGTEQAACGQGMGRPDCVDGLRCSGGLCRLPVAMGAACHSTRDACIAGESCVANASGGAAGRCVADGSVAGTLCRAGASECDAGLFCILVGFSDRQCRTVGRSNGARCDDGGTCSFENACVVLDPANPYQAECRFAGNLNTDCANDAGCLNGMRCVGRTMTQPGKCLPVLAANELCDVYRRQNACGAGLSCVREGAAGSIGRCVASGSRAGSACRGDAPLCDMGLSCAQDLGTRCVSSATQGMPCDPRFASIRCTGGTTCRATSLDIGTCETPTRETEPNDTMVAAPAQTPLVVTGSLTRFDVDCVAVAVAQSGAVFAQAVSANGACNNNFVLDLYDARGVWIGSDSDSGPFGCPRIDSGANPWAASLAAGNYLVCLREGNGFITGGYALSINARR